MVAVRDDPDLHVFIGAGRLRSRSYGRCMSSRSWVHSRDGTERWLNWVIRRRDDGRAVRIVQATVTEQDRALTAEIA
jgi:hypothetical protein